MLGTSPTQRGLKLPTKFVSAFAAFALVFSLSAPTFALSDDDAAPVLPVDSQVGGAESGDTDVPEPGDEAEGESEEVEPAPVADEPIVEEPAADEPSAPAQEPGTESEAPETDESDVVEPVFEEPADEPSQQQVDPLGSLFALTADEPDVEWNPEVTVFLADGTTPYTGQALEAGAELVVKGTGFDPEANVGGRGVPIPAYLSQGTYVVFGSFADTWRPSAGAPGSSRTLNNASQGWVLAEDVLDQVPTNFQGSVRNQWVELSDSGEFTATITLRTPTAPLADGNWGIYTYAAGGVNNAAQETYTPINYFAPSVQVFLEDGTTPYTGQALEAGAELVVKGYDFYPEANVGGRGVPIPAHLSQGTYVVFSSFAQDWRPSKNAPSANRAKNDLSQGWVLAESVVDQVPTQYQGAIRNQWVELSDSGEFTATITLHTPGSPIPGGNWGIYTYGAGGVNNAGQETYTPINYFAPAVQVFLEDGTTPYVDQQIFEGDKLVVKGTGFSPEANKVDTRLPIPAGHSGGTYVGFGSFAENWLPSAGAPSANRKLNTQARSWVLHEDVIAAMDDQYKPSVLAQWAELSDEGEFMATIEVKAPSEPLEDGNWGIYTYAAGGPNNANQEIYTPVNYAKQRAELEVFLSDGETPYDGRPVYTGDTLVVKGSNYLADDNIGGGQEPIPADLSKGNYVVFGNFADSWQPSSGANSSSLGNIFQRWVLPESVVDQVPAESQDTVRDQWVELQDDNTFSFEFTVPAPGDRSLLDRNWGVYSYAAGGVVNAKYELSIPINFLGERDTFTPEIAVYLADGETRYTGQDLAPGDYLVVKGVGFDPAANVGGMGVPIPADLPQGAFVVFGSFADEWQPSAGAPASTRQMNKGSRQWVLPESVLDQVPTEDELQQTIRADWAELNQDGTFTATVELLLPNTILEDGNWGIYTYAAGVGTPPNAAQELSLLVNFDAGETGGTPEVPEDPELGAGTLRWGISSSFLNYVESLQDGSVTTSAGATRTDWNVFEFPQAEGSTYDVAVGTGEIPYQGVVNFSGHGGAMSANIAAPSISIIDANSAEVYVTFGDGRVHLADVDLSQATKSEVDGVITYTDAPVVFTDEGVQSVFAGSRPSSTDPLSFAIGSSSEVDPGDGEPGDGENPGTGEPGPTDPQTPVTPLEPSVAAGDLKWGVSASFRSYLGGMSDARITTGQGAVQNSNGIFEFDQATGSTYSIKTGKGNVPYFGWVNFNAHGGVLNVTIANPAVEVVNSNYAKLTVEHNGNRVHLADLDLSVATKSTKDGVVTYKGVKVTITEAGTQEVLSGFIFSETDYLTFSVGSAAEAPAESGGSDGSNSGKPGNNGNTGSKPDVEIPVEIPQTEEEQQEREERYACYADSASLKWGFSERFRAYVSGTAYGDWSASGGATYSTPQFAWGNGSGSLDSKSAAGVVGFTGSINFTGHSGILNTTVANPAVEISGDNAYLLLDVAGVTQMGKSVTTKQIRFATLNLARANSSVSGHTTTFTGVPVVLTQAGSNAFGTYPAGFGMDSLNFTYTLNPDCGDVRAIAGKLGDTDAAAATDGEIELDEEMIAEALGDSEDPATDTEDDAANSPHDDDAPAAAVTVPANGTDSGGGLPLAVWIVLAVLVLAGGAGGIVLALRPKKATV